MGGAQSDKILALISDYPEAERPALKAHESFRQADNLDDLWDALVEYATTLGADLLAYHHHAPDFAPDHDNVEIRAYGFPEDWVKYYVENDLRLIDPITQIFNYRVRPVRWSQIDTLVPLAPEQKAYLKELRTWLKGDGLGLPTFGPSGRHGYIGIGRSQTSLEDLDILEMNRLHWVLECFHLRWCELVLLTLPQDFSLDERELKILKSMSVGMSDEIICGIIGAQVESIRRSIRGILKKMGVSDRPSAILRGIGAGLLDADSATLRRV